MQGRRLDVGPCGSFLYPMDKMDENPTHVGPTRTARAEADLAARRAREAAALRANLRRRKAQARAREEKAPEDDDPAK